MGNLLYTIGYGNDAPDVFLKHLKDAGVTIVLDVRREGSKSWCFSYNQGHVLSGTLKGLWVLDYPKLGNHFDTLEGYRAWLGSWVGRDAIECMKNDMMTSIRVHSIKDAVICLLCAEGDPFEKDCTTPRCHRVYVANALVEMLGPEWSVEHL